MEGGNNTDDDRTLCLFNEPGSEEPSMVKAKFRNQSPDAIFYSPELMYNRKIIHREKEADQRFFAGTSGTRDPVETILNRLTEAKKTIHRR